MKAKTIEIPSSVLFSAWYCKSAGGTRPNISGIYLQKNGVVVATNGHLLYKGKCDFKLSEDILIRPESNIAKNAENIQITILNDKLGYIQFHTGTKSIKIKRIMFEYIENPDFPDYAAATKPTEKFLKSGLLINPKYFSLIEKIFPTKHYGISIEFNDLFFITVKPSPGRREIKEEELIIMCMKNDDKKFITQKLDVESQ